MTKPSEVTGGLREQALTVAAQALGLFPNEDRPQVWGVIMETGYPKAVSTLVVFAEGTTSLYYSSGGGVIGAGTHEAVRGAGKNLLSAAEAQLDALSPATGTPLPAVGDVRFYVRTFETTLTAEASERDLGRHRHPLSPLFYAGHAVIAAIRESTPEQ